MQAVRKLRAAQEEQAVRAREAYDRGVAAARSAGRTADVIRAQGELRAKAAELRRRYDPQIAAAEEKARSLLADADALMKKRQALVAVMLRRE